MTWMQFETGASRTRSHHDTRSLSIYIVTLSTLLSRRNGLTSLTQPLNFLHCELTKLCSINIVVITIVSEQCDTISCPSRIQATRSWLDWENHTIQWYGKHNFDIGHGIVRWVSYHYCIIIEQLDAFCYTVLWLNHLMASEHQSCLPINNNIIRG